MTFFLILVGSYVRTEDDIKVAQVRMGWLTATMAVAYSSAPLACINHVCQTKTTESLPFYLIIANFLVTGQWTLYGLMIDDMFVTIPNLLGCMAASAQLCLYLCFPRKFTESKSLLMNIDKM